MRLVCLGEELFPGELVLGRGTDRELALVEIDVHQPPAGAERGSADRECPFARPDLAAELAAAAQVGPAAMSGMPAAAASRQHARSGRRGLDVAASRGGSRGQEAQQPGRDVDLDGLDPSPVIAEQAPAGLELQQPGSERSVVRIQAQELESAGRLGL